MSLTVNPHAWTVMTPRVKRTGTTRRTLTLLAIRSALVLTVRTMSAQAHSVLRKDVQARTVLIMPVLARAARRPDVLAMTVLVTESVMATVASRWDVRVTTAMDPAPVLVLAVSPLGALVYCAIPRQEVAVGVTAARFLALASTVRMAGVKGRAAHLKIKTVKARRLTLALKLSTPLLTPLLQRRQPKPPLAARQSLLVAPRPRLPPQLLTMKISQQQRCSGTLL